VRALPGSGRIRVHGSATVISALARLLPKRRRIGLLFTPWHVAALACRSGEATLDPQAQDARSPADPPDDPRAGGSGSRRRIRPGDTAGSPGELADLGRNVGASTVFIMNAHRLRKVLTDTRPISTSTGPRGPWTKPAHCGHCRTPSTLTSRSCVARFGHLIPLRQPVEQPPELPVTGVDSGNL
jgi:hypothetical protein